MEKQENRICVLESYPGFVRVNELAFRDGCYFGTASFFDMTRKNTPSCGRTPAETILKYDLSGKTEPLYDNTENQPKWSYFEEDLENMKRIR